MTKGQKKQVNPTLLPVFDDALGQEAEADHFTTAEALALAGIGCWSLRIPDLQMQATAVLHSLYGLPPDPFDWHQMVNAIDEEDRGQFEMLIMDATRSASSIRHQHRVTMPDAGVRWLDVRAQIVCKQIGSTRWLHGIVEDVTSLRLERQHQQMIARELNHRIKNSFTLVQAVIAQTIRNSKSIREISTSLDLRIAALATANDLLIGSGSPTTGIIDLLRKALRPFGFDDSGRFTWAGPELTLPPRIVAGLSLGLHELATNACKFGALSNPEGEVRLIWTVDASRLRFTWEERNGPVVIPPLRVGFGTKLIEHCLGQHVGGITAFAYLPEGIRFTADLPLRDADEAEVAVIALRCEPG